MGFFTKPIDWLMDGITRLDAKINGSTFGRVFRLAGSGHPKQIRDANFSTELRAGLTTFATMAYIIAVNANILADSGGPCECKDLDLNATPQCSNEAEFLQCQTELKRDLITATAALSGLASILFGFLTNLPVALAPGMGLNAYFTYQVVGVRGSGSVPYGLALTAVFVEGFIFIFLAITGMRHWLVRIIPGTLKTACGVGIGLFLTLIGMSYSSGIGIVTGNVVTPLAIGGCTGDHLHNGSCDGGIMTSPGMWIGIVFGGILTAFLMAFRVKSAIIIGILVTSILSWPRNTPFTFFPNTDEGQARFDFFKQVVAFHPIKHTLAAQQWILTGGYGGKFALALFTFLYVDIIDCTATLYSMARFSNKTRAGDGDFPRSTIAYCTDAFCISIGSLLGCSPVTAFIESGAGIAEGGRTGLTAITTGFCFLISIFFAPIFASIPPWATGCTLILVGCLMIRQVGAVNWNYVGDAIPSFVTLAFIPFSYSVAYGLIAGLFVYAVLNSMIWLVIKLSRGSIEPREYALKEYWTWKPAGEKPLLFRLLTGSKTRFWEDQRRDGHEEDLVLDDRESGRNSVRDSIHDSMRNSHLGSTTTADEKGAERIASPERCVLRQD